LTLLEVAVDGGSRGWSRTRGVSDNSAGIWVLATVAISWVEKRYHAVVQ
jgi:hypothetical protein